MAHPSVNKLFTTRDLGEGPAVNILISSASYIFSDYVPGGEFQIAYAIVEHLAKRGHQLHVFAPLVRIQQPILNVRTYAIGNYNFLCHRDYARYRWNWWIFAFQTYYQARRLLRHRHIDIIHHIRPAYPTKFSLCWSLGIPFIYGPVSLPGRGSTTGHLQYGPVAALQNRTVDRLDMILGRLIWKWTIENASSIPVSVPQTWDAVPEIPRQHSCLIPLGTDTSVFHPPADVSEPDPPVIFYAGNLIRTKGVDDLIKAFVHVHTALPNVRLVIAGDGPEAALLARLAEKLGVSEGTEFLGPVPFSEMPAYYRHCTLFCLPTLTEAFGISLIQAMASGRPVVATRVGGIPSFVEHGRSGLLVPPQNPDLLATALIELLADADKCRRMGQYNRALCVKLFDWEVIVDKIEVLYRKVLSNSRSASVGE